MKIKQMKIVSFVLIVSAFVLMQASDQSGINYGMGFNVGNALSQDKSTQAQGNSTTSQPKDETSDKSEGDGKYLSGGYRTVTLERYLRGDTEIPLSGDQGNAQGSADSNAKGSSGPNRTTKRRKNSRKSRLIMRPKQNNKEKKQSDNPSAASESKSTVPQVVQKGRSADTNQQQGFSFVAPTDPATTLEFSKQSENISLRPMGDTTGENGNKIQNSPQSTAIGFAESFEEWSKQTKEKEVKKQERKEKIEAARKEAEDTLKKRNDGRKQRLKDNEERFNKFAEDERQKQELKEQRVLLEGKEESAASVATTTSNEASMLTEEELRQAGGKLTAIGEKVKRIENEIDGVKTEFETLKEGAIQYSKNAPKEKKDEIAKFISGLEQNKNHLNRVKDRCGELIEEAKKTREEAQKLENPDVVSSVLPDEQGEQNLQDAVLTSGQPTTSGSTTKKVVMAYLDGKAVIEERPIREPIIFEEDDDNDVLEYSSETRDDFGVNLKRKKELTEKEKRLRMSPHFNLDFASANSDANSELASAKRKKIPNQDQAQQNIQLSDSANDNSNANSGEENKKKVERPTNYQLSGKQLTGAVHVVNPRKQDEAEQQSEKQKKKSEADQFVQKKREEMEKFEEDLKAKTKSFQGPASGNVDEAASLEEILYDATGEILQKTREGAQISEKLGKKLGEIDESLKNAKKTIEDIQSDLDEIEQSETQQNLHQTSTHTQLNSNVTSRSASGDKVETKPTQGFESATGSVVVDGEGQQSPAGASADKSRIGTTATNEKPQQGDGTATDEQLKERSNSTEKSKSAKDLYVQEYIQQRETVKRHTCFAAFLATNGIAAIADYWWRDASGANMYEKGLFGTDKNKILKLTPRDVTDTVFDLAIALYFARGSVRRRPIMSLIYLTTRVLVKNRISEGIERGVYYGLKKIGKENLVPKSTIGVRMVKTATNGFARILMTYLP